MSSKKHRSHSSFAHVCENSERYVLLLSFETNDETEHLLNSLRQEVADNISTVQDDLAVQIRVPLERYHIATVNPAWCRKHRSQSAGPDWLPLARLHTSSLSNDRGPPDKNGNASPEVQETCEDTEAIEMTISEQDIEFAELIHALADKLPATGHYLDVIWLATSTTDALISDHISLYGALQRLCSWHGALLTVVLQEQNPTGPDYDGCLAAWVNHLHGRLVGDEQAVMEVLGQGTAWRGEVVLADGKGQKSLSLPGFVLRPHQNDSPQILLKKTEAASVCASPGMKPSKSQAARKIVTFSRQLEVVCTVCRASVPSTFLSPVTLSLQHLSGIRLPRSKHFLSWLSEVGQSNDAAVIMRLRCRTLALGAHSTRSLSTKAWKDHIKNNSATSDLIVPDLHLRETQEFFYLLVHRDPGPSQEVITQVMYSPQEMSGEVHAQLSEYQQSLTFDGPECQNAETALNTVACLDGGQVQRLLETITLAQAEAIKTFIEERSQEGREPAITLAELQLLMGTVYSSVMAEIDEMSQMTDAGDGVRVHTEDDLGSRNIVSESDLSPSCWMQRLALQNHEALERKIKRFKSGDMMLAGMPVPVPADNTITLTADEFLKHFKASGLPTTEDLSPVSTATVDRPGGGTLRNSCPSLAWGDLKKATFQESQKYTFPGIQYCLDSGRSQQIDRHFSKMQQRYIRYETASTCSSEQAASPATLTLPQPATATDPTPATRKARGQCRKDGQGTLGQRSDERGQQRPAVRAQRSVERAQRVLKGQRSAEKRRRIALERGHKISPGRGLARGAKKKDDEAPVTLPQKILVPTRTSPRKRVTEKEKPDRKPLAAKTSEDDQKAAASVSSSKPRKLSNSEKTRMKLRQVVKETILSRGITKENACYKACTERLYRMSELYVKDLKSSKGLNEEMKNIAEANADFVVQFEQNRMKNS